MGDRKLVNEMPMISVIIPCFNVEQYVRRCVDSVLAQTIGQDNMEVILVDDCSTDHTPEILREYEADYPCVKTVFYEKNLRQGGARNRGMEVAQGKYLGFVDSDDWVEPDMFRDMCEKAEEYDCDFLNVLSVRDQETGFLKPEEIPTGKPDQLVTVDTVEERKSMIASGYVRIGAWNGIFRREMAEKYHIRFPEHLAYEDLFWGSVWHLYIQRAYLMEKRYYHYFVRPGSTILANNQSYHEDFFSMQRLLFEELSGRGAFEQYGEAISFDYLMNDYLVGLKILALRYDPFPYELFYQLQSEVRERIPGWKTNPYVSSNLTDFQRMQLELIGQKLTHAELDQMAEIIRKYNGK